MQKRCLDSAQANYKNKPANLAMTTLNWKAPQTDALQNKAKDCPPIRLYFLVFRWKTDWRGIINGGEPNYKRNTESGRIT